jgi:hypothetical protein
MSTYVKVRDVIDTVRRLFQVLAEQQESEKATLRLVESAAERNA